jgi:hypothetical protein
VTTSTNPWAPPEEPDADAVLTRLEMMIEPSFDDIDLPRPAEAGAELPWLSGGAVVGIEPDFDTTGLPAPAAPDALHAAAAAQLLAPEMSEPDVGPPAFVPAGDAAHDAEGTLPPPLPVGPTGAVPAPPGPGGFAPPSATAAATQGESGTAASAEPPTATAEQSATSHETEAAKDAVAAWSAPDPTSMPEQQLPSPMAVRAALEESQLRRASSPERRRPPLLLGLIIAIALVVVAVVVAVAMVVSGDDEGFVPVAVVPAAPSGEVVEERAIPLVLPAFTPMERTWNSIDVRHENTTESSTTVLTLSGPANGSVTRAVTTIQPIDLTVSPSSEEVLLTDKYAFTLGTQGWVRSPVADVGASDLYGRLLVPRTFDMVVPSQMRALVTVVAVEDLGGAGLRRYTLEVRTGTFATQYPDQAETWAELVAWSEALPDRTDLIVDVDETGLVVSSTVTTLDGVVMVGTALSGEPSTVEVPTQFSRSGAPS